MAQGDSDSIGCCFVGDGVVEVETIAHEVGASAVCLSKAA